MHSSLKKVAQTESATGSAIQREFGRLIKRIEQDRELLERWQRLLDHYRFQFSQQLQPLRDRQLQLERDIALRLHQRLSSEMSISAPKKEAGDLTPRLRQTIARLIVSISAPHAVEGDQQMRAIHDQYSEASVQEMEADTVSEFLASMQTLGIDTRGLDENAGMEEVMATLRQAAHDEMAAEQAADEKRKAKRAAKKQAKAQRDPKLQASLAKTEAAAQAAKDAIREIYRLLARQLHPDRASSEAERQSHHELMSLVNVAYEKQDLLSLLQLQLQAEQLDAGRLNAVADEKLRAWNALLKEQLKQGEMALSSLRQELDHALQLPPNFPLDEASLQTLLKQYTAQMQGSVDRLADDLQVIQSDAGLKKWAKEQERLARLQMQETQSQEEDLLAILQAQAHMRQEMYPPSKRATRSAKSKRSRE